MIFEKGGGHTNGSGTNVYVNVRSEALETTFQRGFIKLRFRLEDLESESRRQRRRSHYLLSGLWWKVYDFTIVI